MNPITYVIHGLGYLKARAGETSTWVSIGATVAAVSTLAAPWSYIGMGCGIISAMLPNHSKPDA
jgi:hypothetical protein